jgi:predicted nuclease of restriction endonuclease-like (RecB) superfamily
MTTAPLPPPDYATWLQDVKARIQAARIAVARSANRELILLYWDLGRGIVEKQEAMGWGKSVVETLSADLREAYPGVKGFSANNLWLMRQFYTKYSAPGFLEQCVQDLPVAALVQPGSESGSRSSLEQLVQEVLAPVRWGHHVEIVKKVKGGPERLYYLKATARFGWTRAVLLNQIKAQAYARSLAAGKAHNFPLALSEHLAGAGRRNPEKCLQPRIPGPRPGRPRARIGRWPDRA